MERRSDGAQEPGRTKMTRRDLLQRIAVSPLAGGLGVSQTQRRRNVVLLVVDPGARLPQSGTQFARAYAANPEADPALASILTGRFSHATGVLRNGSAL